ncbi:Thyroid adenoma-associated protein homolog [Apodemus speciosus]|uniref:tRNA (32-2'-O)-methyltransferase regulator THADA n=1 Tax=Apodemus speciosus TaxID=105296 RepID=A0ABQ0FQ80_APOSI
MGVKKKREMQVAALTVCHQDLETLRSFADVEGKNLASLLLHCVQLTDGVSQIHSVKQIVPLLEKVDKNGVCDPIIHSCLDILAGIYFSLNLKNPLKKVLASQRVSSLNGLPEVFLTQATHSFTFHLQEELNAADLYSYRKVIDNISSCMENFNLGRASVVNLLEDVLHFLQKSLIETLEENRKFAGNRIVQTQLMNDLLVGVRVAMTLAQKVQVLQDSLWNDSSSPIWQRMCGLLSIFTKFLNDDDLLQTVQSTSGLAVVLFIKTMFRPSEKLPGLISSLLLQSADCTSIPEWFVTSCRSLCCADVPASTLLFLCQGTLAMLDWQDGNMGPSGEALLLDTVHVLFTLSSQIKESTLEMFLSRILASWTNSAIQILESRSPSLKDHLNGDSSISRRLLEYVYTHWEHPLDALRHQTKIIFRNLLQMHRLTTEGADLVTDPFFLELTKSLMQLEWHIKGKYACLGCLVERLGIEHILAIDKTIPSQILEVMGDQSLVPYASDLLETMFKNHKSHLKSQTVTNTWMDKWHDTWVFPVLSVLCGGNLDQRSYVIDYYLPRLLNYSPESLHYMVQILQASIDTKTVEIEIVIKNTLDRPNKAGSCNHRGALGALMACLRTARAHGHLQSATHAWENLVCSARVKQGLIHQHCQVRIDTLGLLCESNRSTEVVSTEEMQWVQFFITYNLNSQSPGVRQQICSLLKKVIQESSQVLYKLEQRKSTSDSENQSIREQPSVSLQQYKNFISSVCNILFEALFPGSSYSTRFSALTILGSIAEVFSVPEVLGKIQTVYQLSHDIDAGRYQILMECFTSTFEEVKTLAFDLLMKLSVTPVQFQSAFCHDDEDCALLQDSEKLQELFKTALELSTSTKPYDCVTASYLLNLLIWQDALPASLSAPSIQQVTHGAGEESVVVERNTLEEVSLSSPGCPGTSFVDQAGLKLNRSTCFCLLSAGIKVIKCLMENLEDEVSQAEHSLLQAAASFPMYGRVHCITRAFQKLPLNDLRLVSEWRPVLGTLLLLSYRLSTVVSPVIQSSSPEGLIPMDTDSESASRLQVILNEIQPRDTNDYFNQAKILKECDSFDLEDLSTTVSNIDSSAEIKGTEKACDVTAQMVLACCWRSMKEVALLLGTLCQLLPMQPVPESSDGLLTVQQVKEIGDYFKQQLLQSRHRGAFELAYTGFVKLTEILNRCSNVSLQKLPEQWLWSVLEEIKGSDPSSKLCATRRSAGIPFYIQWALLASEPKKGRMDLLKITMKELISLALSADDSQGRVPQVHALNILRALFRDTRLGENIIPFVAGGAKAAILGFTSPVWAVRNSSTLLFSSLITRVFGVKRGKDELSRTNRMTGREFFSRFPELYPFLLKQLETVANTVDSDLGEPDGHPGMFLLLLVLERLYPSPMDGTTSALSLAPFVPFIIRCGHSPIYRSREMAARALVPFIMIDQIPSTLQALLDSLPNSTDQRFRQNHLHGTLLQGITAVFHLLQAYTTDARHRTNAAMSSLDSLGFWEDVRRIILGSELITGFPWTFKVPGLPQYLQSLTRLAIPEVWASMAEAEGQATAVPLSFSQLLKSSFPEVRLLTLDTLLERAASSEQGQKEPPPLLYSMGQELLLLAMKENHPGCFCRVLKILYHLNPSEWLPQTERCVHLSPKEFLIWTMDIASNDRSEIQGVSLKLASKIIAYHVQSCEKEKDSLGPELRQWVQLVVWSCGDHLPTASRLAVAEVLTSTAPLFLTSPQPMLELQDTLSLWRCVLTLLQSEEQTIREAATEIVTTAMSQENTCQSTEFAFCQVDASIALTLALAVVCDLLRQWDQLGPGLPILLGWLLEGDDLEGLVQSPHQGEEEHIFEKSEVNFWAETLTFVKYLCQQLFHLLCQSGWQSPHSQKLCHLKRIASEQRHLVSQLFRELPLSAEFLKSVEYTRLRIQEARTSLVLRLLTCLERKEVLRAEDWPKEWRQVVAPRTEAAC